MDVNKEILLSKESLFTGISKLKDKAICSIGKVDKFIISAHATFEGIGIAGLISAAFWYTTAPLAPDGFKGPISTFTITVSTIASLFLAIPIACYSFKKLIADIDHLHADLARQINEFIGSYNELMYGMLKLRSLFFSNEEFKNYLFSEEVKRIVLINNSFVLLICKKYNQLKNSYFMINWQHPVVLISSVPQNSQQAHVVSFEELIHDTELSANKLIRKALIDYCKNNLEDHEIDYDDVIHEREQHDPEATGQLRNIIYGIASGVACTEVLLSIGWTVISILIGVDAITPISNLSWIVFAVFSIFIGILFGLGMGLSRHKQKINQLFSLKLKRKNEEMVKTKDRVMNIITKKLFQKQKDKNPVTLISH